MYCLARTFVPMYTCVWHVRSSLCIHVLKPIDSIDSGIFTLSAKQKIIFSIITLKGSILRFMFLHNSYIDVLVAVILHLSRSLLQQFHVKVKTIRCSLTDLLVKTRLKRKISTF